MTAGAGLYGRRAHGSETGTCDCTTDPPGREWCAMERENQEMEPGALEALRREAYELLTGPRAAPGERVPWTLADLTEIERHLTDAAVIVTDLGGTVTHWSGGAERLYGYTPAETVGQPASDLLVEPGDRELVTRIRASLRLTGTWEGEYWVRRKEGGTFLAYVFDSTVEDDQGRPAGYIGVSYEMPKGGY
jgi:PAS domain S-box-containing protein